MHIGSPSFVLSVHLLQLAFFVLSYWGTLATLLVVLDALFVLPFTPGLHASYLLPSQFGPSSGVTAQWGVWSCTVTVLVHIGVGSVLSRTLWARALGRPARAWDFCLSTHLIHLGTVLAVWGPGALSWQGITLHGLATWAETAVTAKTCLQNSDQLLFGWLQDPPGSPGDSDILTPAITSL